MSSPLPPVLTITDCGVGSARLDYRQAWAQQRDLHAAVVAGHAPNTVLLLEHPPTYTAGKRTAAWERPTDGTEVIDVDRGGRITWHGPGQIVGYPVVRLPQPLDVVAFVRLVEQVLIDTCAELGVTGVRIPDRSGVWVREATGQRKLAAVGLRVAQGVSLHGFSLNCDPDLSAYQRITPCGITDAGVSSLSAECGRKVTVTEVAPLLTLHLNRLLPPYLSASAATTLAVSA